MPGTSASGRDPRSDRLVDAVVAHGTVDAIASRLTQHLDAGADHVPVQVLTSSEKLVPALTELAGQSACSDVGPSDSE